jgi:hypothetical protein
MKSTFSEKRPGKSPREKMLFPEIDKNGKKGAFLPKKGHFGQKIQKNEILEKSLKSILLHNF